MIFYILVKFTIFLMRMTFVKFAIFYRVILSFIYLIYISIKRTLGKELKKVKLKTI